MYESRGNRRCSSHCCAEKKWLRFAASQLSHLRKGLLSYTLSPSAAVPWTQDPSCPSIYPFLDPGSCGLRHSVITESEISWILGFGNSGIQEPMNSGIPEFWNAGIVDLRNSGMQEFRNSGLPEFRNSGIQESENSWIPRIQEFTDLGIQEFRYSGIQGFGHSGMQESLMSRWDYRQKSAVNVDRHIIRVLRLIHSFGHLNAETSMRTSPPPKHGKCLQC